MELLDRVERKKKEHEEVYADLIDTPLNINGIFMPIVDALRNDYVGFDAKRKKYFRPNESHTYIMSAYYKQELTVEMMVRSLHQFAAEMHDRRVRFICDDWVDYRNHALKYRVRATEDALYVTSAEPCTGLVPGDKIIDVQHSKPSKVRYIMRNIGFNSNEPERELWGGYLRMARNVLVEHADGTQERLKMELYPDEPEYFPVAFRMLDDTTAYLQMERMDDAAMTALLAKHEAEIAGSKKLIVDLRRNVGGDEGAAFELFKYMVSEPTTIEALYADEGSYVLYSKDNCERRYNSLETFKAGLTDPELIAIVEAEMAVWRANYGKGLVFEEPAPFDYIPVEPAEQSPEQVVLLTDTFCEKEGEQFAAMAQRCGSKVTTIGRPTMGTLDYYDVINLELNEHMTFAYPIRMTKAAYEGRGIDEKGLAVDEYIAWTPEEIERDVILEKALAL